MPLRALVKGSWLGSSVSLWASLILGVELPLDAFFGSPAKSGSCRHPRFDHIASDQNDRNCAVRRADRPRERVGGGNNHVRVPVDDLASEIAVALGSLLAGIPPDVRFCASASPSRRSSFQNGCQRRLTGTVTGATRGDLEQGPTLRGTGVSNPCTLQQ